MPIGDVSHGVDRATGAASRPGGSGGDEHAATCAPAPRAVPPGPAAASAAGGTTSAPGDDDDERLRTLSATFQAAGPDDLMQVPVWSSRDAFMGDVEKCLVHKGQMVDKSDWSSWQSRAVKTKHDATCRFAAYLCIQQTVRTRLALNKLLLSAAAAAAASPAPAPPAATTAAAEPESSAQPAAAEAAAAAPAAGPQSPEEDEDNLVLKLRRQAVAFPGAAITFTFGEKSTKVSGSACFLRCPERLARVTSMLRADVISGWELQKEDFALSPELVVPTGPKRSRPPVGSELDGFAVSAIGHVQQALLQIMLQLVVPAMRTWLMGVVRDRVGTDAADAVVEEYLQPQGACPHVVLAPALRPCR